LFFALKAKAIKLVPLEIAGLAMWLSYLLLWKSTRTLVCARRERNCPDAHS
jgi:hypothetical protein